jgi:beta-phosphoglucomutase
MDGTLIDSADYHFRSWRETLLDHGLELSYPQFAATFGQRNDAILRGWLGEQHTDEVLAAIGAVKEDLYRRYVAEHGMLLLPGVGERIAPLRAAGGRPAVASSAPRANLETIVDVLGLAEVFDATVAAEDVQHGKPDPEVFLRAAERLGVPPERCIVVEDAPAGAEAGRRAGMRVIGVGPNHATLGTDRSGQTLDDLPQDVFEALIG